MAFTANKSFCKGIFTAFLVLILDQLTKIWILSHFQKGGKVISLTPFFDLVLVWNRGVSFGFLNSLKFDASYLLTGFAVIISIFLGIWLWRNKGLLLSYGLGLILGGALGNALDRLRYSAVVDFLYFHAGKYSFPSFNIADSAITIGVMLILLEGFLNPKGAQK
jgi:signal peptidase II